MSIKLYEKSVIISWEEDVPAMKFASIGVPDKEDFFMMNEKLWAFFVEKQARYLIMDVRYQGPLFESASEWIHSTWYPTMIKNGMRKEAVIMLPEMMQYIPPDKMYTKHDEYAQWGILEIKYFDDMSKAIAWLKE